MHMCEVVISVCSLFEVRRQKAAGRKSPAEGKLQRKGMINDGLSGLELDPEVTSVRELQLASSFRQATDLIINITWVVWAGGCRLSLSC